MCNIQDYLIHSFSRSLFSIDKCARCLPETKQNIEYKYFIMKKKDSSSLSFTLKSSVTTFSIQLLYFCRVSTLTPIHEVRYRNNECIQPLIIITVPC